MTDRPDPLGGRRRDVRTPDYRLARDDDLLACAQVWSDSIGDYVRRLNQPWFGGDLEPLRRLLAHFVRTDAERFWVATEPAGPTRAPRQPATRPRTADRTAGDRIVGFGSATLRGDVWFLGMLFVLPELQGTGVGRRLLEHLLPAGVERLTAPRRTSHSDASTPATADRRPTLGTATDSVQPISNALYSQYGMVPRLPVFNLVGRPERLDALGAVPAGIRIAESTPETRAADMAATAAIDAVTLGYAHPEDHAFLFSEGRRLFIARAERGDVAGYGSIAPSGRFGPVAAADDGLLAPIVGHLLATVRAPGAYASWIPGAAGDLLVSLLAAGFRFESFPTLLLWDRPIGDFSRYVPINLALL